MRTTALDGGLLRTRRPMVVLVAICVIALGLLTRVDLAGAQTQAGAQSWSITPAGGSPDQPGTRPELSYTVDPGTTITDTVQLWNYGDAPIDLHVYVADALITTEGSYDVKQASDPGDDVSSWTKLGASQVNVPAKSSVAIGVRIAVPADAIPGDHPGGIVASVATPTTGSDGAQVTVEKRVGTRLNVRVNGTVTPAAEIQDVSVQYDGTINPFGSGTATVKYTFVNAGNSRLSGRVHLELSGLVATLDAVDLPDVPITMPGNTLVQTYTVKGVWPVGPITAKVSFTPNDDQQLGDITQIASAKGSGSTFAWPFGQVLLLVVIGGVVVLVVRRRRAKAAAGPNGADGGTDGGGSAAGSDTRPPANVG